MADWTSFRFLPDGSKVCGGSAAAGLFVADVAVAGDGLTLVLSGVTKLTGYTGLPLQVRWLSTTVLVFVTTEGVWTIASPWTTPTLVLSLSTGVRIAGGSGGTAWTVEYTGSGHLQTNAGAQFSPATLPDMDATGRLLYVTTAANRQVILVAAAATSGTVLDENNTILFPRLCTQGAVWARYASGLVQPYGKKTAGSTEKLAVSNGNESVIVPIDKGAAIWLASYLVNQTLARIVLRPWPTTPTTQFQVVQTGGEIADIDGAWDGSKFRIGWTDFSAQFHGLAVTPAFTDAGVAITSGGGSGGGTGGSTGGSTGGGTGGGVVVGSAPIAPVRFARSTAPLLPHLSTIPPGPARQAVKVLYDRLNQQERDNTISAAALTNQLAAANTAIANLQRTVDDNQVAAESFFATPAVQSDISNETRVPTPPGGEPGGGGDGGGGGGGGNPPIPWPEDQRVYVEQMAEQFPAELAAASTSDDTWLRHTLQTLRSHDTRWGRNINPSGALSNDKLAYYYGDDSTPREGSTSTYTVDCISDLGGANHQTYTLVATGLAKWTSHGEF